MTPETPSKKAATPASAESSSATRPPAKFKPPSVALLKVFIPAVFVVLAVAAIAFMRGPSADTLLRDAADSFAKIKRGTFEFQIGISPRGTGGGQSGAVKLGGPFELVPGKPLPKARIEYTISSGSQKQSYALITTGTKAYTESQGQAYELPASAVKQLKTATAGLRDPKNEGGGLSGVDFKFDKWLIDPKVSAGGEVGGASTWKVESPVDVPVALSDLLKSAGSLGSATGGSLAGINTKDLAALKKAVERAYVEVYVGEYDHLLRKLDITLDIKLTNSKSVAGLTGGRIKVIVAVSNPNEPVDVQPPVDPLPFKALQSLSQLGQSLQQPGK